MSELPEGISPAEPPKPRSSASGIVLRRPLRLTILLRPICHAAEFDDVIFLAAKAYTGLPVKDRAPAVQFDKESGDEHDRCGQRHKDSANEEVKTALHKIAEEVLRKSF